MPRLTHRDEMIVAAKMAGRFTRDALVHGNANHCEAIPATWSRVSNNDNKEAIWQLISDSYQYYATLRGTPLQIALGDAKFALGQRAGNCDQHASVAFAYLFQHDVYPIYKASLPGHTFVIIGRPPTFVICDPWADRYDDDTKLNDWLNVFWPGATPNFWNPFIRAASEGAGGSPDAYRQLTIGMLGGEAMDLTD